MRPCASRVHSLDWHPVTVYPALHREPVPSLSQHSADRGSRSYRHVDSRRYCRSWRQASPLTASSKLSSPTYERCTHQETLPTFLLRNWNAMFVLLHLSYLFDTRSVFCLHDPIKPFRNSKYFSSLVEHCGTLERTFTMSPPPSPLPKHEPWISFPTKPQPSQDESVQALIAYVCSPPADSETDDSALISGGRADGDYPERKSAADAGPEVALKRFGLQILRAIIDMAPSVGDGSESLPGIWQAGGGQGGGIGSSEGRRGRLIDEVATNNILLFRGWSRRTIIAETYRIELANDTGFRL